jgi:hypothetical protein
MEEQLEDLSAKEEEQSISNNVKTEVASRKSSMAR